MNFFSILVKNKNYPLKTSYHFVHISKISKKELWAKYKKIKGKETHFTVLSHVKYF